MRAWARRPSSRRSHWAKEPRPGGRPRDHHLEDAAHGVAGLLGAVDRARSWPRRPRRRRSAPGSPRRRRAAPRPGASPAAARRRRCGSRGCAPRRPRRASSGLAPAPPAATRAVVSRALARSSTSRRSSVRYFRAPARSAWPGRGCFSARRALASGGCGSGDITSRQFSWSLLRTSERHRAAQGPAVADAGEDLHAVGLDLHAAAAAVAALAPAQVRVDRGAVHGETGGQAVHHHGERGAVRLAGGQQAQHPGTRLPHAARAGKPRRRVVTPRFV